MPSRERARRSRAPLETNIVALPYNRIQAVARGGAAQRLGERNAPHLLPSGPRTGSHEGTLLRPLRSEPSLRIYDDLLFSPACRARETKRKREKHRGSPRLASTSLRTMSPRTGDERRLQQSDSPLLRCRKSSTPQEPSSSLPLPSSLRASLGALLTLFPILPAPTPHQHCTHQASHPTTPLQSPLLSRAGRRAEASRGSRIAACSSGLGCRMEGGEGREWWRRRDSNRLRRGGLA